MAGECVTLVCSGRTSRTWIAQLQCREDGLFAFTVGVRDCYNQYSVCCRMSFQLHQVVAQELSQIVDSMVVEDKDTELVVILLDKGAERGEVLSYASRVSSSELTFHFYDEGVIFVGSWGVKHEVRIAAMNWPEVMVAALVYFSVNRYVIPVSQ